MIDNMKIIQAWNGWIIEYTNPAGIEKQFVFQDWKDVTKAINRNFGFFDENEKLTKDPSKSYSVKIFPNLS